MLSAALKARIRSNAASLLTESSQVLFGDDITPAPYPRSWDELCGQEVAVDTLRTVVRGASHMPVPHVLIAAAAPGVGKSSLARLFAKDLGRGFTELGGSLSEKESVPILRDLPEGTVVFLDEVHAAKKFDWMLSVLQDGVVRTATGTVALPSLVFVAATTDISKLPLPFIDRFAVQPRLVALDDDTAADAAGAIGHRVGVQMADSMRHAVVAASGSTPRVMHQLLTLMKLRMAATDSTQEQALEWTLHSLGRSADGLDSASRDYLMVLLGVFRGSAALSSIQAAMGGADRLVHTERILIQRGLVEVTSSGRKLTAEGVRRAREALDE